MLLLVNVKKYQEVDDVITHLEVNIFDRFVFYIHIIENTLIQSALTVFISSHLTELLLQDLVFHLSRFSAKLSFSQYDV